MKYKQNDKVYIPLLRHWGTIKQVLDNEYYIGLVFGTSIVLPEIELREAETNEDWIRSLSTNELAVFNTKKPCEHCYYKPKTQECDPAEEHICIEGQEKWLKDFHIREENIDDNKSNII